LIFDLGYDVFADFVHPRKPFTSPAASLPYSPPFILFVFIYIKCKILKTEAMQWFRMQSIQYKSWNKISETRKIIWVQVEPWKIKCQTVFGKITCKTLETLLNKAFKNVPGVTQRFWCCYYFWDLCCNWKIFINHLKKFELNLWKGTMLIKF
jgi:hypothetical protein